MDAWCIRYFNRDARHLAHTLTARLGPAFFIFRLISGDRLLVRVRLFQANVRVALAAFRLMPLLQSAHLSWIDVHPSARAGLVSRPLLQNLHLIQRDCGVLSLTLEAGLTHGGYVWAISGFLPINQAEWSRLARRLQTKMVPMWGMLTLAERGVIAKLLASPNPLALRAIALSTISVGQDKLGKFLLMGENWKGVLDFTDHSSMLIYFKRIGVLP